MSHVQPWSEMHAPSLVPLYAVQGVGVPVHVVALSWQP
jgi:hypothetical protein